MYATLRSVRLSSKKARVVSGMLRGRSAIEAFIWLGHVPSKAALVLRKVLRSAMANAEHNGKESLEHLVISEARIDGGASYRRFKPGSKGRAKPFRRPTSHVSIRLVCGGHHHHDHSSEDAEKAPAPAETKA